MKEQREIHKRGGKEREGGARVGERQRGERGR